MNGSKNSSDAAIAELCPACGLCCNGVIFANVRLQPGDNAARLRTLGVPVCKSNAAGNPQQLAQPCAAYDGCHCRVYPDRPQYCREFECFLLKNVKAGCIDATAALHTIGATRARVDKVRSLLTALGDTDEQLPLSKRFRRTTKRLSKRDLDSEKADKYSQLTVAFHELNLVLSNTFYPGNIPETPKLRALRSALSLICAGLFLWAAPGRLLADQVQMRNGDLYAGRVLSVNSNTVMLQSKVLGALRLPRAKVAIITLGTSTGTNSPALPSPTNDLAATELPAPANVTPAPSPAFSQLGASTNLIQQVQKQFLSSAGPEANAKFNELLGGLMSGKLNVEDIRAEAKSAADQLRALQRESGEDAGFAASAYLTILDHFLKETAPSVSATNAHARSARSKAPPVEKDE